MDGLFPILVSEIVAIILILGLQNERILLRATAVTREWSG